MALFVHCFSLFKVYTPETKGKKWAKREIESGPSVEREDI